MKHKFNAVPTIFNNKRYASRLEAAYAQRLHMAKKSGELLFWLEQTPFCLPGGLKYRIDFVEFWKPKEGEEAGEIIFTEVKGVETTDWIMRKKLFEAEYGLTLNVVKK